MSYTNLKYHIVFSTKDRRPIITPELKPRLVKYIGGIIRKLKGKLLEANGPEDHLHIATGIHPQTSLSGFLRDVKASSSGWVHDNFPELRDFAWQDGHASFTVSQSVLPKVIEYIRNQVEHHKTITFQEELIALLRKHEIEFDERYILA